MLLQRSTIKRSQFLISFAPSISGSHEVSSKNSSEDFICLRIQLLELHLSAGDPICWRTLSSHCKGPLRWSSIQHGVDVTVFLLYSSPQPLTKDILMVHIRARSYTASKPWFTDWPRRSANFWLLKIFRLQPGGILQTVAGCHPYCWLQFGDCTKIEVSERHSANTSPPI